MKGIKGFWYEDYKDVTLQFHQNSDDKLWQYAVIEAGEWIDEAGGFYTRKSALEAAKFAVDFMQQNEVFEREYVVLDDEFEAYLLAADETEYRVLIASRYPQPSASEVQAAWQATVQSGAVSVPKPSLVEATWQRFENLVNRAAWMDEFELLMEGK